MGNITARTLLDATATGWGPSYRAESGNLKHSAWIQSTSTAVALAATVEIYGSDDQRLESTPDVAGKVLLATVTLTGTGATASEALNAQAVPQATPYAWLRHKVTAISGTGARVKSTIAEQA